MRRTAAWFFLLAWGASWPMMLAADEPQAPLAEYVRAREAEFDSIPRPRRELLGQITAFVRAQREAGRPARLTFICTHNSRRSQMAQAWAAVAAEHYGIDGIEAFSGGTEATAFNPRAVAALARAGLQIASDDTSADNPRYTVHLGGDDDPTLVCFSKRYEQAPNPSSDFAAVMTCSDADRNCPTVAGAQARIALPYDDPKTADGTPREAQAYDERSRQIAREMLFVFAPLAE